MPARAGFPGHPVSTILSEEQVIPSPGDPFWKVGQIVSHDFTVPMKIHNGLGVGVNGLVVASQLAPVDSIDPIRIGNWVHPREKITA